MIRIALLGFLVAAQAPAVSATPITTVAPLNDLVACLRDRLQASGRVTAINTAAGTMLDFTFDAVGVDGKVQPSRLSFTVEDHGTERTLTVAAANPADTALAQQYLRQAGARCTAGGETHAAPAHGAR